MTGRVLRFPRSGVSSDAARRAVQAILAVPSRDRPARKSELGLDDPDTLLAVCQALRERLPSSPQSVLQEAEFFYRYLERPRREIGLFDERAYFLGETALLSGMACRLLALRDHARTWFDRAEAAYRLTVNAVAELSRLAYQRLALDLEERRFDYVLELVQPLAESFTKLGMDDDALKCNCLEALCLMEMGEAESAIEAFNKIRDRAQEIGAEEVLASAYVNLVHLHAIAGNSAEALNASSQSIPILRRTGNRVDLAKVQWGIGTMLRGTNKVGQAIEAYRSAQQEFHEMEMMADVAAAHLVIADLLLDVGQEARAIPEILAALPIIDSLRLVPEGVAALSLLRESVKHQRVNRQALRDLHGCFEEFLKNA